MNYKTRNERRGGSPLPWIILLFCLVLVGLAGISVNLMRNGHDGFMTNLWDKPSELVSDPYLDGNPIALSVPGHVKTVLLMGSDFQPGIGFRTDTMLLVAMNTKTSEFHMLSFPRDLWVNIPGVGPQRLNTAAPFGGNALLGDTLAANFGIRPDNYAMVNFDGFKRIVEVLGGIDVDVEQHMEDECWLNDVGWCVVEPGRQHMSHGDAFWYVRARKNSSDIDRNRRQQEVMKAIIRKALNPVQIPNLPKIFMAGIESIQTDMGLGDMFLYAVPFSKFFGGPKLSSYQITFNEATPGMTDGGASVLYPDINAIQNVIREALWID
jgi:LCP family protein required for cell wall assembly